MCLLSSLRRLLRPRMARGYNIQQCEYSEIAPRITVPHRMIKLKQVKKQQKTHSKGPLIISCKRKQFNHYLGQTYSDFDPKSMASGGWKHPRSVGDYFMVNAYRSNPSKDLSDDDPKSFKELGLSPELTKGLEEMGITTPTTIQVMAIPEILKGINTICVAETGSGKTLAYLLPIIEKIKRHQQVYGKTEEVNAPYAVILVPSRELAEQIHAVSQDLAKYVNFTPHCVIGGQNTQKLLKWKPRTHMDIVISTPGVLSKILTNNIYQTKNLLQIILDEADSLLDDSFNALTGRIISKLQVTSEKLEIEGSEISTVGTQVALVGATAPRDLAGILGDIVPLDTLKVLKTEHVHCVVPHVTQKFLRVSKSQKPELLLQDVTSNLKKKIPTIVFCNSSPTACFLSYFLEENQIQHILLNANLPRGMREGLFKKFQDGEVDVLICTDMVSRGLDTIRVQHVINYDFPDFISNYLHRVGRVGRVGSRGSGFALSYICNPWEVELLWNIETAVRKMKELFNVNANIKRKLQGLHEERNMMI